MDAFHLAYNLIVSQEHILKPIQYFFVQNKMETALLKQYKTIFQLQ